MQLALEGLEVVGELLDSLSLPLDLQAELAAIPEDETPEQEDVGALFADTVRLACAG